MKFNRVLKQLNEREMGVMDRWEIFKNGDKLMIRGSGSNRGIGLEEWISQDKVNHLKALKALVNKILGIKKDFSYENMKKILGTVFEDNNKIPDFTLTKDKQTGAIEGVEVSDSGELARAKKSAEMNQLSKSFNF